MPLRYGHTQTGALLRLAVLLPLPAVIVVAILAQSAVVVAICAAAAIVAGLAGLAVSSLTIEIDAEVLRWSFGCGVWRKRIDLADIASTTRVRNPWWYGFGIHRTPRGWLYNVAGLEAIEIGLRDGTTLRLGTDEPEKLMSALATARQQTR